MLRDRLSRLRRRYVLHVSAAVIALASGCDCGRAAPASQDVETLCDGFDNDGDGRVDVSRPFHVAEQAQSSFFHSVNVQRRRDGFDILWSSAHRTDVLRLAADGTFLSRMEWADSGYADGLDFWLAAGDELSVVTWTEDLPDGGNRLHASLLAPDGGVTVLQLADGGSGSAFGQRRHQSGALRSVVSADGQNVMLFWANLCEGWFREGMTVDREGRVVGARRGLIPYSNPGACLGEIYQWYVALADGTFGDGYRQQLVDGGEEAVLRRLTRDLQDAGTMSWPISERNPEMQETAFVTLGVLPQGIEDVWVYSGSISPKRGTAYVWAPTAGPDRALESPTLAEPGYVDGLGKSSAGVFAVIREYEEDGGVALSLHNVHSGARVTLRDAPSPTHRWATSSVQPVDDRRHVAFFSAAADGGIASLYGVMVCAP